MRLRDWIARHLDTPERARATLSTVFTVAGVIGLLLTMTAWLKGRYF